MASETSQKPQRMIGIRVSIVRCIDDDQWPTFIECEFVDAYGKIHRFNEKSAIVTAGHITSTTPLPCPAVIACEIIERSATIADKSVYLVDTELPWHVSSTEDRTRFDVFIGDLVEWEFGCSELRPWNEVT